MTVELFFDSGPTADWTPPASLGAKRIIITQTQGIGTSDPRGLSIDIPAVVAYTRTLIEKHPDASPFVCVNDVEGHLETVYLETAMGTTHPDWEQAVRVHVALLDEMHGEFPGYKFAFYARPRLPAWVDPRKSQRWGELGDTSASRYIGGYRVAYAPIMAASGWLCPSVYDHYEPGHANLPGAVPEWNNDYAGAVNASAYANTTFCRIFADGIPVIPFVTPYWTAPAYSTVFGRIPIEKFMRDQVQPCIDAGATGVCVYTGLEWALSMAATNPAYSKYREDFEKAYELFPVGWQNEFNRTYLHSAIGRHTREAIEAVSAAIESKRLADEPPVVEAPVPNAVPTDPAPPDPERTDPPVVEVPATPTIEERLAKLEEWQVTIEARLLSAALSLGSLVTSNIDDTSGGSADA